MKLNIKIELHNEDRIFMPVRTIVDIDINNGNWKYWDDYMETLEKETLTINSISKSYWLDKPVKDAYGFIDNELWKNERKIEINDADVRTYDTLLYYLNCRIDNAKEWYKKFGDKEHKYTAVLFDEQFKISANDTVVKDITYRKEGLIEVKITVIE